jgi:hypothetical protein
VFQKLDAQLAAALVSIGAVKGVEFGDGFALAARRGSQTNDAIAPDGFVSNHMGGLLGGISSGAAIVTRIAVKPTSSIRHEQQTIDTAGQRRTIKVPGRHDPCICARVVPVAEAMVALVLCDAFLRQQAIERARTSEDELRAELAFCDAEILRLVDRRRAVLQQLPAQSSAVQPAEQERLQRDLAGQLGFEDGLARRLHAAVCEAAAAPPLSRADAAEAVEQRESRFADAPDSSGKDG